MNTRFTIEEENIVAIYAEDSRGFPVLRHRRNCMCIEFSAIIAV